VFAPRGLAPRVISTDVHVRLYERDCSMAPFPETTISHAVPARTIGLPPFNHQAARVAATDSFERKVYGYNS
jgi:hypothetical protein